MSGVLLLIAGALIGASVAVVLLTFRQWWPGLWRLVRRPPEPPPVVLFAADWDAEREARRLRESAVEIQELYRELGYSLPLEWRCDELLAQSVRLIRAEVPDLDLFRRTLDEITAPGEEAGSAEPLRAARRARRDDAFLREVVAALGDPAALDAVLNRDPLNELLPFVEEIPFYLAGKVIWRTPIELRVLRKRPSDRQRFAHLIGALEHEVRSARLRRSERKRSAVLTAVARVERDLKRPDAYLPTPIKALAERLDDWLRRPEARGAAARRRELDELLAALVEVRHGYARALDLLPRADPETLAESLRPYRQAAREQVHRYLQAPWMHRPALTTCALHNLLVSELAALGTAAPGPATPAGVLAMICAETASGHYDDEETSRRLRRQEERGLYVHSLVFALLRLHGDREIAR